MSVAAEEPQWNTQPSEERLAKKIYVFLKANVRR
jgi:hypothetical protein